MDQQTREDIAEMLLGAYSTRKPVEPLTERYDMGTQDAYEIQLLQVARWTAAGDRIRGHKVGLTSAAMQRQMSVDQPDYGHLLDRMFWPEQEPIPLSGFLQPRVEPETAFVLAKPLRGPGVTIADAIAAGAAASAETVQAHRAGFERSGCDELIFVPGSSRLDQVTLLAEAIA